MSDVRGGRGRPDMNVEHSTTVLSRDDQIYADNLDELMELFRSMRKVLEEVGFDDIHEEYAEHWETLPFKNKAVAYRWKDPYTAIEISMKGRVKSPRSDRKTGEDIYKVKITVTTKVVRFQYPHYGGWESLSWFQRTIFYKWMRKLYDSILFRKEQEKYEEEAEELGIEFVSRMREIEGSIPAIGKSKREWYNPNNPR